MSTQILVVEDDEDIALLVKLNLEMLGFAVHCCRDGAIALELAASGAFHLLVLDVMLPSMDGLDLCQKLRSDNNFTPILMLTAKNSETDRVVGLEVGADDYLTKPFSVLELQARVKALLRRVDFLHQADVEQTQERGQLRIRDMIIDIPKRAVQIKGRTVELTAKEFDLLLYLASSPGHVYSREQLLNAVWGYTHSGYEHTVNSHINRLRRKVEKNPADPDYVLTVWGVGYKFNDQR